MENIKIITNEQVAAIFEEEDRIRREILAYQKQEEIGGLLFTIYRNKRTNEMVAVQATRTVHMGFNSNEPGKVEEFIEIMEREGMCMASWGVTGRTMHQILAGKLADSLPQYDWEIGYNYHCKATKK